jgi:peptidoglycan/LPS O-acetylase OafA/YrhL
MAALCYFLVTSGLAQPGIPQTAAYLGVAFFIGNSVYVFRNDLAKLPPTVTVPMAIFTFAYGGTIVHDSLIRANIIFDLWSYFVLVVLCVSIGSRIRKPVADLSFSLYLLHALIISEIWWITGYGWGMFVAVLAIALPLCLLSWFLIEKPSQKLKELLLRRRSVAREPAPPLGEPGR